LAIHIPKLTNCNNHYLIKRPRLKRKAVTAGPQSAADSQIPVSCHPNNRRIWGEICV